MYLQFFVDSICNKLWRIFGKCKEHHLATLWGKHVTAGNLYPDMQILFQQMNNESGLMWFAGIKHFYWHFSEEKKNWADFRRFFFLIPNNCEDKHWDKQMLKLICCFCFSTFHLTALHLLHVYKLMYPFYGF